MSQAIDPAFLTAFAALTPAQQAEVMGYIRALKGTPQGTAGQELAPFAGSIPADDLATMQAAIREGCEQVDHDGW